MKTGTKPVTLYNGKEALINMNAIPCDPDKFKSILRERGLFACDMSESLGYSSTAITNALFRGQISGPMAFALEHKYHIGKEDYEYVVPIKEEKPKEPEQKTIMKDSLPADETALYEVMKSAVVDAINEAFATNAKQIRGTIAAAVAYAVRTEINRKEE